MRRFKNVLLPLCYFALIGAMGGCGGSLSRVGVVEPATSITLMDPNKRQTIMTSVSNAINALTSTPNAGLVNPTAIATVLKKTAGIKDVVLQSNGNVSAEFTDGVPFLVENDEPVDAVPPAAVRAADRDETVTPSSVPENGNVVMLDGMGNAYTSPGSSDVAMFQKNDYNVVLNGQATVANLKKLGSINMAVLYLSGHGGDTSPEANDTSGSAGFGFWTADAYDPSQWNSYVADVTAHRLAFMMAGYNTQKTASGGQITNRVWHYAILPKFILDYKWQFASDSLVMLNCCLGGSTAASNFRGALFAQKASAVAAWTDVEKSDHGFPAASYMFDRMLGANMVEPVVSPGNPPRRPFNFTACKAAADARKLTNYIYIGQYPNPSGTGSYNVQFTPQLELFTPEEITDTSDQFSILKPSIDWIYLFQGTDGKKAQLHIGGNFGVPGGTNTSLSITSQSSNNPQLAKVLSVTNSLLTASVADTVQGSVTVQVKRSDGTILKSNPRIITAWSGQITTTITSYGGTKGSNTTHCAMTVDFRAGLGSTYAKPDDLAPTTRSSSFTTSSGKVIYTPGNNCKIDTMQVTASGEMNTTTKDAQGNVIYSITDALSGGGTVGLDDGFNGASLSIPTDPSKQAYLQVFEDTKPILTDIETIIEQGMSPTTTTLHPNAAFSSEYFLGDQGDMWLPLKMDKKWNVSGDTQMTGSDTPGGTVKTLTWPNMPCMDPPDFTIAQ